MATLKSNYSAVKPADYYHVLGVFDFEKAFDHVAAVNWFHRNWWIGLIISFIYILFIFIGKKWMEYRDGFKLRLPLTVWSWSLAVFSWMCALRAWSEFYHIVQNYGWHETVCDSVYLTSVSGFWGWLFVCSKAIELGDTLFIILRKQKLIFLHWYHHITVLLYTWYSYGNSVAPGRYFFLLNTTVHGLMYTYYTAKASKIVYVPSGVNIFITLCQISQMAVGIAVNLYASQALKSGKQCGTSHWNINVSLLMYFSYFLLFINFFCNAYFNKKTSASDIDSKKYRKTELIEEKKQN